ncbi:MAG: Npt1/Npt2 family nucleotide transporter [Pseudomonadota bacterium]|nr:Npt1/Npt2 family nucleotide transporter [Pseudomonadota bacterium]
MDASQYMTPMRSALFPIYNHELKRFIPSALMVFFTILAFHLLRNSKDALVIYAPGSGAEVIPFLKLYVVLPASIIFSIFYMRLRKALEFERTYYIIVSIFISVFILFAYVLYPNSAYIHPDVETLQYYQDVYPRLRYFFAIWGAWSYALFYLTAELWGTYALNVLFWQFANDTTSSDEAQRFFPLYVLSGNAALICLYPIVTHIQNNHLNDIYEVCGISSVSGVILMGIFWFLNNHTDVAVIRQKNRTRALNGNKKKLTFFESLKVLSRSKYIGYVALLVLAYGMIINMVEVVWKAEVRIMYTDKEAYYGFIKHYILMTGIATIVMNYTSKGLIRKLGWKAGAMITPIVCGVLGSVFFIYVLNQNIMLEWFSFFKQTPLFLSVWLGALSVLLSKCSKYSFFDPTKEMAYIPLDIDLRTNGKAAVDGVGGRLGKSIGGFIVSGLLQVTSGTMIDIASYLSLVILIFTVLWLLSVFRLNDLYCDQVKQQRATLA